MKYSLLITILLLSISAYTQTWPSKDCIDTPHIKGRSSTIYHTGNCSLKLDTTHVIYNSLIETTTYNVSNPYVRLRLYYKGKKLKTKDFGDGFYLTARPTGDVTLEGHTITYDSLNVIIIYK